MDNRPYSPSRYDHLNQTYQPSFQLQSHKKFINHEIEKNIRKSIKWELLNEYDEAINECYDLLAEIENDNRNFILRDSRNIYLTYNGKSFINQLKNLTEIENELSHISNRKAVKIIDNTENIVEQRRKNPQIIYLLIFLIPNKIEPQYIFDIYSNVKDGNTFFNFFTYTHYLEKRLNNNYKIDISELDTLKKFTFEAIDKDKKVFYLELKNNYFINLFLWHFTRNNKSEFIEEWLIYFFKTLRRTRQSLVLIGNRDVSEEMFYNAIIEQVFGHEYCITLTNEIFENQDIEYIVREKLFIHINYIPEDKNHQLKLKNLLDSLIVYDYSKQRYGKTEYLCQIIFTLDAPHPFLNDYLSSSKVFFIDSLSNINEKLDLPDRISLLNHITKNLNNFSEQLSGNFDNLNYTYKRNYIDITENEVLNQRQIHYTNNIVRNDTVSFNEKDYKTDNELYRNWIKNPDLMQFALTFNSANPILDPFHDSFGKIIPKNDRYKHTYITGKTGSGKSELLKTLIYRDILNEDCSVILLDIHGDLAKDVARLVKDKERLVLIDPILEKDFTPTINIFETDDKSEENIEQISQMISSVISSISVDDKLSGTMIDLLENCIPVLIRIGNKNFYELKRFMKIVKPEVEKDEIITIHDYRYTDDKKYNDLIRHATFFSSKFEEEYFKDEFIGVADSTKRAIKRRLNKILKDSKFSNLTNGKNTVDLQKEMNTKGKIIIFNIPKSKMLSTYTYYIKFIIGLIQIIALKRADIKDEKKRPHTHLYIDEFHNFITPTIEEILAESRKYKLFLTLAHQSVSQIKDSNLRDIILDNTNIKIIGKNSNKTLDTMNKTLNTKLENVEKLETGEFYIQSGTNDVIKIKNTTKLLNGNESISNEEWEEHKQYQLKNYYRSTIKEDLEEEEAKNEIDFDEMIDEFIKAIKTQNLSDESCLRRLESKRFEEIEADFNFEKDGIKQPRIRQQEINIVFQLAFNQDDIIEKTEFFKKLKEKDSMFDEAKMMTRDKKYRGENPQEKYYLIP